MPVVDAVSLIEPPECAEGFIADFLHHACDGETSLRPGDVVSLESGIAVKGGHIVDIVCMQGRVDVVGAPAEDSSHCGETASWLRVRARVATASTGFAPPGYLLVNGVTSCSDDIDATEEGWLPVSAVVDSTVSNPKGYVTKMFNVYFEDDHPFGADACRGKVQIGEYDIAEFVIECPSLAKIWDRHQSVVDKVEGVVIRDDLLDSTLVENLMVGVDRLIESQGEPDFHPNTNGVVLDIVHPSLYPYVRGITKVINEPIDSRGDPPAVSDRENAGSSADGSESDVSSPRKDRWGRRYEDSKFQWLPSVFEISGSGTCAVKSYINNLPMENNVELVAALERLFEAFVPLFEACYSYIRAIRFHDSDEDDDIMDICRTYEPDIAGASLRNRELKVVTKIVEYQLGEGDSFDGVWHVEGMSHESIVMTGLFILDRDEGFDGGELLFKRAFLDFEASSIFEEVPQCRHQFTENIIDEGLKPLGKVITPKGRLIVFPNSHVHKLSKMFRNDQLDGNGCKSKRRIIVFWLVDPERKNMISTQDVRPPQQLSMTRDEALQYRLQLMEERKRFKQDWNVRPIELCEH